MMLLATIMVFIIQEGDQNLEIFYLKLKKCSVNVYIMFV